jgi:hypothetical protein
MGEMLAPQDGGEPCLSTGTSSEVNESSASEIGDPFDSAVPTNLTQPEGASLIYFLL